MSTLRTFNLQNPDSGTVNIEMDQGGNTLMTGIATVRGAAHFTSTSGSDAVGIGTDITAYKLDVRVTGAEAGLRVYNPDTSSNASGIIRLGNDDNQNSAFLKLNGANNSSTVGGAANLVLGTGTARQVHLATNGTSRLAVRSDGKISAGTLLDTNNSYEFSIRGADGTGCLYAHGRNHYLSTRSTSHASLTLKKSNSDSDGIDYLQMRDSSNAAKFVVSGDGTLQVLDSIKHMGDTDTALRFPAADTVTVETGGSERLRIRSDGRVTIGTQTINTNSMLSIHRSSSDESQIRFTNTTTGEGGNNGLLVGIDSNEHGRIFNQENSPLRFGTNNTERLRIDSAGNLIIDAGGDAQDIQIISHSANSGHGKVYLRGNASNESSSIHLNHYGHADYHISAGRAGNGLFSITRTNGGSDGIIMDSSGNMGLGVTPIAPGNTALHIGETTASQPVRLHMTTATTGSTASDGFTLSIDGSSSVVNMIQRENAAIALYSNNTESVRVDNNGMIVNNGYRISTTSGGGSFSNPYSLGSFATATIPSYPHFTGTFLVMGSIPCNNTWHDVLHSISDSNGLFHGYSGDASSKNIFQYQYSLTSPAYGVNILSQRFMNGAWNTGSVSFQIRNNSGAWTLQIKATSHYSSNNVAGFRIMFHSYY